MADREGAIGRSPVVRVSARGTDRAKSVLNVARDMAESVEVIDVGPPGITALAPLVLVTSEGETAFHADVTETEVRALVDAIEDGDVPEDGAHAVIEHDPDTRALPVPDHGPLAVGRRRALAPCGWVKPTSVDDVDELAAEDARSDPEGVLEDIAEIGLLGRGRGDASTDDPVVEPWTRVGEATEEPVVVVNGNEADPNARMDSLLLESAPVDVLDGALAVAAVIDAADVVVYVNETNDVARERVDAAAGAIDDALGGDASVEVAVGPDTYRAGEMTMALESLEGNDRIEARRRPPMPDTHGLFGRPTVIHTPRTLAQVRGAITRPEEFDPDDADPGTRVVTVAGDVEWPATVELPTGGSLATATEATSPTGSFKFASVGGIFGGLTRDLDVPPSAGAMRAANLGTNGIIERFDDETCVVATVGTRAKFAREENCGRCVPCREGSKQLVELLREIYDGEYQSGMLRELTRVMGRSSICDFGQTAQRSVVTAMNQFETEFTAHAEGHCPTETCTGAKPVQRRPESSLQ